MAGNDLKEFYADLRSKLGRMPGRARRGEFLERARTIPLTWNATEFPSTRSVTDQFKQALLPWGAQVQALKSRDEVMPAIAKIFQDNNIKRASRWKTPFLDSFDWAGGLASLAPEWIIPSAQELDACSDEHRKREFMLRLANIEAGITDCAYAVAHTGSLLCLHDSNSNGYTSLFPWVHIAIVPTDRIVRDLPEAFTKLEEHLAANPMNPTVTFVTGPSRSGDIDIVAGQGAAGPGKQFVLFVPSS